MSKPDVEIISGIEEFLHGVLKLALPRWVKYVDRKSQLERLEQKFRDRTKSLRESIEADEKYFEAALAAVNQTFEPYANDLPQKSFVDNHVRVQIRERVEVTDDEEKLLEWAKAFDDAYDVTSRQDVVLFLKEQKRDDLLKVDKTLAVKLAKDLVLHDPSTPATVVKYVTQISKDSFQKTLSTLSIALGLDKQKTEGE